MEYQIQISQTWPYRHPDKGRRLLIPGIYRIPEDLPDSIGRQALDQGVAITTRAPEPRQLERKVLVAAPKPVCDRVEKRFGRVCVVAASGPSLTEEDATAVVGLPTIAVNDAYRLIPTADVLYAGDETWWDYHADKINRTSERWSAHGDASFNDKRAAKEKYGLHLVRGVEAEGFSMDPSVIHYGGNSGFQAINLAIHMLGGKGRIILVGFDMRAIKGKRHFFGEHPKELVSTKNGYKNWPPRFDVAAKMLPPGLEIINCTPGSALKCFPQMSLAEALA